MLHMLQSLWRMPRNRVPSPSAACDRSDIHNLTNAPAISQRTKRIMQLVGLPPEHFEGLYRNVINNAVANLSTMQFDHHSAGRRLHYALSLAERALNVRQAYLLPTDVAPEDLTRRSDRWTYGVFIVAFMRGLNGPDHDRSTPSPELTAKLLPRCAFSWLESEPELLRICDSREGADPLSVPVIHEIITRARGKPTRSATKAASEAAAVFAGSDSPLLRLSACIDQLRNEGRLSFNRKLADAFVTDKYFWLEARSGLGLVRSWLIDETGLLAPGQNELLDYLQGHRLCISTPDKDLAVWNVEITHTDGKKVKHRLLCFAIDFIWPDAHQRPPVFYGKIKHRWSDQEGDPE